MKYYRYRSFILFLSSVLCAVGLFFLLAEPAIGQGIARKIFNLRPSCTALHGYSLKKSEGLGDYELGVGELAWRSCIYDGIRQQIVPNSAVPNLYEDLIRNDVAMTALIGKKELTRKDRRVQNLRSIIEIEERENQYLADQKKQLREQAKTAEEIQNMQDFLELQRRSIEITRFSVRGLR